jgi:excisionase family DNA binding protein
MDDALTPLAYSVSEAVKVTSLSRAYLYRLMAEGKLQSRKFGKRKLIPAASLRALIETEAA